MKVIKEGKEGGSWSPQLECTGAGNGNAGCGAILEVSGTDLFHTKRTYVDQAEDHYLTFECPLCNEWTDINEKITDVPYGLRGKVIKLPAKYQSSNEVRNSQSWR